MRYRREQYLELMTFGRVERPMFVELFGPLIGLEEEWRQQGASDDEINLTAFEWDYVPNIWCGGCVVPMLPPPRIIEDTPEQRIEIDGYGRTMKLLKKTATIPLPMDFPVKTMEDWLRLKPLFEWRDDRVQPEAIERARRAQAEEGAMVVAGIGGAFDTLRELMGEEMACLAYYDQPELVADVLATMTATTMRVLEQVSEMIQIDQLTTHEDFAGRSGPLVGPDIIRNHFVAYYRQVWGLLSSRGARLFLIDTDGNINSVIDALLECGINLLHPMEPAAGMDIVRVRQQYGRRAAVSGGIDKHILRRSKPEIRAELEYKMQPFMHAGTVFGLDHRIPNGTPLEDYRYYVDTGREILGLPPRQGRECGWARMAF